MPTIEQLRDIDGLDLISWWPPAMGWWALLACGIIAVALIAFALFYWIRYRRSWKRAANRLLLQLSRNLDESTALESVALLSQYIRRIALKRFSRNECAALFGDDWLQWLKEHDPKQFDWVAHGKLLIQVPYAPESYRIDSLEPIKVLIDATRHWVR